VKVPREICILYDLCFFIHDLGLVRCCVLLPVSIVDEFLVLEDDLELRN
jgi:hypothetical protein